MRVGRWIKNAAIGLGMLATTAIPKTAEAQTFNAVAMETQETSRLRTDLFYNLPGSINNYTFIELYQDGYFSKTIAARPIKAGIGPRLETVNTDWNDDELAFGIQKDLDIGEGNFANISLTPYWINMKGETLDKQVVGAAAGYNVPGAPRALRLEGFANYDVKTDVWDYGEVYILMDLGAGLQGGLHLDLLPRDTQTPNIKPGIELRKPIK